MSGPENLEILEPLGADQGTFVARDSSGGTPQLVVVERVTRASPVPAARAELLRRGRALKALEHPKVVRVRDVFERDGEVLVVSDFVDGEWLSSLMMMQPRPPLGLMLRIVIDVLEGLGALHGLHDEHDQSLGFVHGALGPDTVLVAEDGVAEIARACRLPRPGTNERYVAPEFRRGDEPANLGCDIYAAGSILRDILVDAPSDATWAEPLTDIAWRACSVDPENRWPSALAMATTVRRIAGSKLATAAVVAEFMRKRFGERMAQRRSQFETLDEWATPPESEPASSVKPSDIEVMDPSSMPTLVQKHVQTLPPPPVQLSARSTAAPAAPAAPAVAVARVTLVKKPSLVLVTQEAQDPPELPDPATRRRPEVAGHQGISVPPPTPAAQKSLPPAAAQKSLPPVAEPRSVPPAGPQKSLPPPTIVPQEAAPVLEAYRRQMPTFPIFEPAPPPRRRTALQGMVVATAIVGTFVVGWWLGRKYAPPTEEPVRPSVPTQEAARPTTPTAPPAPAPTPSAAAAASSSPTPVASVSSAPAPSASASATPVPAPPAWAVAPRPTAQPAPVPSAAAAPPAASPAPSAKPGGFVPEEL